jgi:hypothetical protein
LSIFVHVQQVLFHELQVLLVVDRARLDQYELLLVVVSQVQVLEQVYTPMVDTQAVVVMVKMQQNSLVAKMEPA